MNRISLLALITLVIGVLTGCGGESPAPDAKIPVALPPPPSPPSPPTVAMPLSRASYAITRNADGSYTVTLLTNATISMIPATTTAIGFADMSVNLSITDTVKATSAVDLQALIELYIAYFNRLPDADGLEYWARQLSTGWSLDQIGMSFYSAAIKYSSLTGYTATMTNADFVNLIYRNVLGRTPDVEGLSYWVSELDSGRAMRGTLIRSILGSAHSFKGDPSYGYVADLLDNKLKLAVTFAIQQGLNYNSSEDSITNTMALAALVTSQSTDAAVAKLGRVDWGFSRDTSLPSLSVSGATRPRTVIAAGRDYSIALKADGTVWTWGNNWAGQLCLGDTNVRSAPTLVSTITDVVEIATEGSNTFLIKRDGSVWVCGIANSTTPTQVYGLHDIVSVAGLNVNEAYALDKNGTLIQWDTNTLAFPPAPKAVLSNIVAVRGGDNNLLALKKDASVWVIGANTLGQLGTGDKAIRNIFEQANYFNGATAIAISESQSCVVTQDGRVFEAGFVYTPFSVPGLFDIAIPSITPVPITVPSLSNVANISAGTHHVLALKKDGTLWTWGEKLYGATGLGIMDADTMIPAQVPGLTKITAISAGYQHSMALKDDGTLWVSGSNSSAQLGTGRSTNVFVQVPNWHR